MAFDEQLANRVREVFAEKKIRFEEKRMFGGLCFMMVRLDPAVYEESLGKHGCVPMDFTGNNLVCGSPKPNWISRF